MKIKFINTLILISLLPTMAFSVDFTQKERLIAEARAEVNYVTAKQLYEMLEDEEEVIVLDIREIDQRPEGTIPTLDKYEVTRGQIEFEVPVMFEDKNIKIVSFCRNGPRSVLASKTLVDMGYKNAVYLKGGLKAWLKAGYSLKTGLGFIIMAEDPF